MSNRERKLIIVLGIMGICGLLFAAYQLVIAPLEENKTQLARLSEEYSDKDEKLTNLRKDLRRLTIAKKRSLPSEPDVARREYEAMLTRLLRNAGIPPGYTIASKDNSDMRSIPLLAPKRPAYSRIGYSIRLTKVDLPSLTKFLQEYYRLNLLHQIVWFEVKRSDEGSTVMSRRGIFNADRNDLTVIINTEAIILDGAENRRTLLPIPTSVAAVAGGAGYFAVSNSPEAGRVINPQQFVPLLATSERNYLVMAAKDPYHGPLPTEKIVKATELPVPPPAKPLEDISPYIKLNGIVRSSDGTPEAGIWDISSNKYYAIRLKRTGEKTEVDVRKYYFLNNQRKPLDSGNELVISEEFTSTNRTFKVNGFHEDGMFLTETIVPAKPAEEKPAADAPKAKWPPQKPTKPTVSPATLAIGSAIGGMGMLAPAPVDKFYFWRVGQTLQALKELPPAEAKVFMDMIDSKVAIKLEVAPTPTSVRSAN